MGESNACRNTLERKLTLKSNELQGFRDNFKGLESQNQSLKSKLEDAKKTIREQEDKLRVLTNERNDLERNFTIHLTENNVGFFVFLLHVLILHCFVLPGVQGLFTGGLKQLKFNSRYIRPSWVIDRWNYNFPARWVGNEGSHNRWTYHI